MTNQKPSPTLSDTNVVSQLILNGDLSKLSQTDKVKYYNGYCERIGLDPFTKPFDILRLNGKEVLYCTRSGTQQLNKLHGVSHKITARELIETAGVYQVSVEASLPDGRFTESIGAVNIAGMKGEMYANSIMKAETKAKRRATLDLLGLGIMDETEAETIPNATTVEVKPELPKHLAEVMEQLPEMDVEITPIQESKPLSLGNVMIAISKAKTIKDLTDIYYANQRVCDTNELVKDALKTKKNELK